MILRQFLHRDPITKAEFYARLRRCSIHQDMAVAREVLQSAAGELRHGCGEEVVQALAGAAAIDLELRCEKRHRH